MIDFLPVEDPHRVTDRHRLGAVARTDGRPVVRLHPRGSQVPGPGGAPRWIDCGDRRSEDAWDGWMQQHREITALGLPPSGDGAITGDVLRVALFAGVPVALWRRGQCAGPCGTAAGDCDGGLFRQRFQALWTGPLSTLPEFVRDLRTQVQQDPGHACVGLVLLWDDPESIPGGGLPLRQPEAARAASLSS